MKFDIDKISKCVIDELESIFNNDECVQIDNIPIIVDQATDEILNILKKVIYDFLEKNLIHGNLNFLLSQDLIIINSIIFSVYINVSADKKTLHVSIMSCNEFERDKKSESVEFKLGEATPYVKAELCLHHSLSRYSSCLLQIIETVINYGFRWLEIFTIKCLKQSEENTINEIYRIARNILPEDISRRIFFFYMNKDSGRYAFDTTSINSVLEISKSKKDFYSNSPIQTVSTIFTQHVPTIKTLAFQKTIRNIGTHSPHNPLRLPSAGIIGTSNYIMHGCAEFFSKPIVGFESSPPDNQDARWLTVAYPPEFKDIVEKKLPLIIEQMRIVFLSESKKTTKRFSMFEIVKSAWNTMEIKPNIFGFGVLIKPAKSDIIKLIKKR